jgi:hypothetical protein
VKVLIVKNVSPETSECELRRIFDVLSAGGVERVKKTHNLAFVHFVSHETADIALRFALPRLNRFNFSFQSEATPWKISPKTSKQKMHSLTPVTKHCRNAITHHNRELQC